MEGWRLNEAADTELSRPPASSCSPQLTSRRSPIQRNSSYDVYCWPQRTALKAPCPPLQSISCEKEELGDVDDGSVASRLLGAIGKSISSPSLSSYSSEVVRETSYQKCLKIRRMQLHHCTEELGSESCASSCPPSCHSDAQEPKASGLLAANQKTDPKSTAMSCIPTLGLPCNPNYGLFRRKSFLTLVNYCMSRNYGSRNMSNNLDKFPPPLDILPPSAISDTLSFAASVHDAAGESDGDGLFMFSLRSCKKDGRFVLREVKMPIPSRCMKACRTDNRLTLRFCMPRRSGKAAMPLPDAQVGFSSVNLRRSELELLPQSGSNVVLMTASAIMKGPPTSSEGGEASENDDEEMFCLSNCPKPRLLPSDIESQANSTIAVAGQDAVHSKTTDLQSNSIGEQSLQNDFTSQWDQDEVEEGQMVEAITAEDHSGEGCLPECSKETEFGTGEQALGSLTECRMGGENNVMRCCSNKKKCPMPAVHGRELHAYLKIRCVAATS